MVLLYLKMNKIFFDPENKKRPYVAANAVIIKKIKGKKHILLGKRLNVHGHGYYYIPGGHIRVGEKIKDALIREVKEECGLDIIPENMVWVEEALTNLHHITLYYAVKLKNDKQNPINLEPDKCEGWNWYAFDHSPTSLWNTLGEFIKNYNSKIN